MLDHVQRGHMHRPEYFQESCSSGSEGMSRDRERMLAELLQQQQGGIFGGAHPALGGMGMDMGGQPPPFMGGRGMHPMMGGMPRPGFLPQMGMAPVMGMHPAMGIHPAMGMHPDMGMGFGMGVGMGPGRPPFGHSPFGGQRYPSFGYGGPEPLRAHSYLPQNGFGRPSPFSQSRHSPFSSSRRMFDDGNDYEGDCRFASRHRHGRQMRSGFRFAPKHSSRRRRYRSGMFEESDDDFDEYEDYDGGFEDEDEYESYMSHRPPQRRWLGGF